MRHFFPLLVFIIFAVPVISQNSNAVSSSSKSSASVSTPGDATRSKNGCKTPVPPEKAKPIVIPEITTPITIDGHISEDAWKTAAVFKDFYQTGPGYNTEPSKPTEVYVMYDEYNMYIAFKCWDDKDKIRATVAKRDDIFGEDNVRMWLDTYDDQRRAYVLGFNPLGIQQDGI